MRQEHGLGDFDRFPVAPLLALGAPDVARQCREIVPRARDYVARHLRGRVERWDDEARHDHSFVAWSAIDAAPKYGFLSLYLPGLFGGGNYGPVAASLFAEEIASVDAGISVVFGAHGLALALILASLEMPIIARLGRAITDAERQGKAMLLSLAHTEPAAGSDVEDETDLRRARVVSRFARVAGGYRLDARKVFISNGSVARWHVVTAYGDPARPTETMAAFLVPADARGCEVGRIERKLGQRLSPATEILCDDVFVPEEDAILMPNPGRCIDTTLSVTRGPVGALSAGIIRGVLERTLAYLDRRAELAREQWVTMALADILAALQTSRAVYMESALAAEAWGIARSTNGVPRHVQRAIGRTRWVDRIVGSPFFSVQTRSRYERDVDVERLQQLVAHASIAKVVCSDLAVRSAAQAMEILGDDANDPRWGVEKCLRDAKLAQIFEGTNQINRLHIARGLLKEAH